ncbi:MAG: hypothetical protein ACP5O7_05480 [Phycisphaerae bacterium]
MALREAFDDGGCPVCCRLQRCALRHMRQLLWESVNDSGVRSALRQDGGLCRRHLQLLLSLKEGQSSAILIRDWFDRQVVRLFRNKDSGARRKCKIPIDCLFCRNDRDEEFNARHMLAAFAGDRELRSCWDESSCLCLAHLHAVLACKPAKDDAAVLLAVHERHFQKLRGELQQLQDDYRSDRPAGAESSELVLERVCDILAESSDLHCLL